MKKAMLPSLVVYFFLKLSFNPLGAPEEAEEETALIEGLNSLEGDGTRCNAYLIWRI